MKFPDVRTVDLLLSLRKRRAALGGINASFRDGKIHPEHLQYRKTPTGGDTAMHPIHLYVICNIKLTLFMTVFLVLTSF